MFFHIKSPFCFKIKSASCQREIDFYSLAIIYKIIFDSYSLCPIPASAKCALDTPAPDDNRTPFTTTAGRVLIS